MKLQGDFLKMKEDNYGLKEKEKKLSTGKLYLHRDVNESNITYCLYKNNE